MTGSAAIILSHLNLTVSDPPGAAAFLARYCGMRIVDDSNRNFIFLTDDNAMVFALMASRTGLASEMARRGKLPSA